jgi:hypothetical protein
MEIVEIAFEKAQRVRPKKREKLARRNGGLSIGVRS